MPNDKPQGTRKRGPRSARLRWWSEDNIHRAAAVRPKQDFPAAARRVRPTLRDCLSAETDQMQADQRISNDK